MTVVDVITDIVAVGVKLGNTVDGGFGRDVSVAVDAGSGTDGSVAVGVEPAGTWVAMRIGVKLGNAVAINVGSGAGDTTVLIS